MPQLVDSLPGGAVPGRGVTPSDATSAVSGDDEVNPEPDARGQYPKDLMSTVWIR